ncbi:MAG: hypothetical protein U9R51_08895 [Actinomycetota bacterium]|nr:hypothetical protein [Actinomycetota bacterium]
MSSILWFHQNWVYVALGATGLVGIWGLALAALRRQPGRAFGIGAGIAITAILIQVAAGTLLYIDGLRPMDSFHVFYGVVIAVTLSLAYAYRAQLARNPALAYGLLLLFVMGLGFRAWTNVS